MEVPLYFAPEGFEENPTLSRSNAFDLVGEECRKVRNGVGILDITAFARYEIGGSNAAAWLDHLLAGRLPKAGRAALAPMLAESGKLKGDLTVFNWGDGTWWLTGSYYLRQWHMRWFEDHLISDVTIRDISDEVVGFSLSGPNSRKMLERLTHQDVSNDAFRFFECRELHLGMITPKVARLSLSGELGYEIHCRASEHATLRRSLLEAGKGLDAIEYGFNAALSLRLEKSFGIWSREFTQDYTPRMTGLDRWIAFDKGPFIGSDAAGRDHDSNTRSRRLVTLEIDAVTADASGYEPIWRNDRRVGFITSGGYGHTIGKSLAMALIDPAYASPGTELTTHIVGVCRGARILSPSPYDPRGLRMRS
jgi:dimethylglycine dehydrogenase